MSTDNEDLRREQVNNLTEALTAMSLRLSIAERVCIVYGWTSLADDSDRSKALYMLWSAWVEHVGSEYTGPSAHPEMTDEWIASLARERDDIRARTLERIRTEGS